MTNPLSALCKCGHGANEHTTDGVCCAKLSTFPDGGFHGVCPCTPAYLEALEAEERFEDALRKAYADG